MSTPVSRIVDYWSKGLEEFWGGLRLWGLLDSETQAAFQQARNRP
ncbi:MAG TPA: hypothetical protein V6D18_20270 [Thermosynechococcaceae cyanobacterium]